MCFLIDLFYCKNEARPFLCGTVLRLEQHGTNAAIPADNDGRSAGLPARHWCSASSTRRNLMRLRSILIIQSSPICVKGVFRNVKSGSVKTVMAIHGCKKRKTTLQYRKRYKREEAGRGKTAFASGTLGLPYPKTAFPQKSLRFQPLQA